MMRAVLQTLPRSLEPIAVTPKERESRFETVLTKSNPHRGSYVNTIFHIDNKVGIRYAYPMMSNETTETPVKKGVDRRVAYQQRHRDEGLCILCPTPSAPFQLCDYHRELDKKRRDEKRDALGLEPKTKCSNCQQLGHNRRSCTFLTGAKLKNIEIKEKRQYRCLACKERGHSIRTCPKGGDSYLKLKESQLDGSAISTPKVKTPSLSLDKALVLVRELDRIQANMPTDVLEGTEALLAPAVAIAHARAKLILTELKEYARHNILTELDVKKAKDIVDSLARHHRKLSKRTTTH